VSFQFAVTGSSRLALGLLLVLASSLSLPSFAGGFAPGDLTFSGMISSKRAPAQKATSAAGAVVEYYHTALDNYFITAEPAEQAAVDAGAAGAFARTGNIFAAGGSTPVCRFYGNNLINPATGAIYGPNSHFYTADPAECAGLKAQYTPTAKSWKFESNDFLTTPAVNGTCTANLTPVYRAYNNGFARGVDSNHRITSNRADYLATVARGWIGEGIVMCAPQAQGATLPPQLGACSGSDCPEAVSLGSGGDFVDVIVEIPNPAGTPILIVIPAGQTFIATTDEFQNGMAMEELRATIAPGTTGRFILHLYCIQLSRHPSSTATVYAPGPITTNAQLLNLIGLASGKLSNVQDPSHIKAAGVQFAVWEITDGAGLSDAQRTLLASLLAVPPEDTSTQLMLLQQFQSTLTTG